MFSAVKLKSTMAGVTDMERWIAVGTQLGYQDQQFHEFMKELQTLKREEDSEKERRKRLKKNPSVREKPEKLKE